MKFKLTNIAVTLTTAALATLISGCASPNIRVSIKTPGQFKLGGISKLAIVKFNSLQGDASVGTYSADDETIRMMQSLVSSVFSAGKTYQVINLEKENAIVGAGGATDRTALISTLSSRFDAIIYGRVWWQIAPEDQGKYPMMFEGLKEWVNQRYTVEILGQPVEKVVPVITRTKDALALVPYRSQKASLMLSLSIYSLDNSGMVKKVVETYSVASQSACLNNGRINGGTSLIGVHDTSRTAEMQKANKQTSGFFGELLKNNTINSGSEGKYSAPKKTVTMPSSLQMKCEMANSLVSELAKKLQPTNVIFEIPNEFSDKKLAFLLQHNAFSAGLEYSKFALEQSLRDEYRSNQVKEILKEKAEILDDKNIPDAYAKSSKSFKEAAENNLDYIYSEAICQEGCGNFKDALYIYRLAFEVKPRFETAMGISRCLFAMDMAERVKETDKERKKAEREARLK